MFQTTCIIMTNLCLSENFGNIDYTSIDYLFMYFDDFLPAQTDLMLYSESKHVDFIEEIDCLHYEEHAFIKQLPISQDPNKLIANGQSCRQELSMDIFEQSQRKLREVPLLYKLCQDFVEQEDNIICKQKDQNSKYRRSKNDTKNIPKNFGKGIMNFIQKHQKEVKRLILAHGLNPQQFFRLVRNQKKTINTIADLRAMWTNQKFGPVMRMMSNKFFREYSLDYIFNSRITSYSTHIKYRQILWEALKDPSNFTHIKFY